MSTDETITGQEDNKVHYWVTTFKKLVRSVKSLGLEDLEKGLRRSEKVCETVSVIGSLDKGTRDRSKKAAEYFGGAAEKVGDVNDATNVVDEINEFLDAVNEVEQLNLADGSVDPQKAGRAFDNLFATVGTLGQRLPGGPWKGYFTFLENFKQGFFANVSQGLDPSKRERDRDMVEQAMKNE